MTDLLIKNGNVYLDDKFVRADILIKDGVIACVDKNISCDGVSVYNADNLHILPGLADVHVHLREPGFSYKETIATGTMAAAKGGFTMVRAMPNLSPVPDSAENLAIEQKLIDENAVIKVLPYAAITKGEKGKELVNFGELADKCFAFSDDGKGVQSEEMMKEAMEKAASLGKRIVAHCEDESLLFGGYIHDGEYARLHGHKGISSASEYRQVERDVKLARQTGVQYHVCHVSTKESVDIIRQARAKGLAVSGETGPHYLAFTDMDLREHGRFKMNPPIRSRDDRRALIEGIKDGTLSVIVTDHAPHSEEEKSKGLAGSSMGVVGLETSFAAVNTYMVKPGHISLEKLVQIMSINPRQLFGLPRGIKTGEKAGLVIVNTRAEWVVDPRDFVSMGKYTPFEGALLTGKVLMTIYDGNIVWRENNPR